MNQHDDLNTPQAHLQFLQFLTHLAPEGETALLVRQTPRRDSHGQLQLHADGALRCTWPAFLPPAFDREADLPTGAWYCNTGSFLLDRLAAGRGGIERPSASADNCQQVLVMVLDDIGTKSKPLALAPTWRIETSPDNEQWGYVFGLDDQPSKAQFAATIRLAAEAGYTDPGACNPVRNFRIPGSVNLKPGRGEFAARLLEFAPEREYTLAQVCAAIGVAVPADVGSGSQGARASLAHLPAAAEDDVLRWVAAQGDLLERVNLEGWAGVRCPNHAEHSDGQPGARYMPETRAFVCFHAHCGDWDSARYLAWVAQQGGPARPAGLRDDLLASTMTGALAKLAPSAAFPDRAKEVIAQVEAREVGRLDKAAWWTRFAYVESDDSYFDLEERREFPRRTFNALFRHVCCLSVHNGRRVEASVCFDENRQAMGARSLAGVTFAAGEDKLLSQNGLVFANRWRDGRQPLPTGVTEADIAPWLAHARKLIPDPVSLAHVLDVMAVKLQQPRTKINHAVLHAGVQGCGKDSLWHPLIWAVCGSPAVNKGLIDAEGLSSPWGYALESEILILNELRDPDPNARRSLANRLKPIIAAPPESLTVNRKGLHPYDALNRLLVVAFSNDRVPIILETQDRRWFAIYSTAARMSPEDAAALWGWYEQGGAAAVAGWLAARDVSAFNPAATPPVTEYKLTLIEQGMSHAESWLVDSIRARAGEFAAGVVASPFHALIDRLQGVAPSGCKLYQAALIHALEECGWVDCGRLSSAEYGTKKHIFAAPDVLAREPSKSDLRRMAEYTVTGAATALARLSVVK